MTRKDFELIAEAIRSVVDRPGPAPDLATLNDVGLAIASALSTADPRFDFVRFLKAAGVV